MNDSLTVMGIDPSFTATGIAVVRDGKPVCVETIRMESLKSDQPGMQLTKRLSRLLLAVRDLDEIEKCDAYVVERTDWMRNLQGDPNWKKNYAIERRNQESLALLQGALAAYALTNNIPFYLLGVNEWHREFGAGNKDAVMMLLAQEFPEKITAIEGLYIFSGREENESRRMNNNETDALGIALVGYNRILKELRMEMAA